MVYALTDRRALISEPRWFGRSRSRSYPAQALTLMTCQERDDGSGDLIFGSGRPGRGAFYSIGFFDIDRVRRVESLVRDLREQAEPALGQSPVAKRDSLGAEEVPIVSRARSDSFRSPFRLPSVRL